MVNDDPLATQEPTGAGNDEETNDEEFFFHGSVEKRLDRLERMLTILCRAPQLRTEQKLKPDRKTEELQLEPTYDEGVLTKWFQEKGYGFATAHSEGGDREVFVHFSAVRGGDEGGLLIGRPAVIRVISDERRGPGFYRAAEAWPREDYVSDRAQTAAHNAAASTLAAAKDAAAAFTAAEAAAAHAAMSRPPGHGATAAAARRQQLQQTPGGPWSDEPSGPRSGDSSGPRSGQPSGP